MDSFPADFAEQMDKTLTDAQGRAEVTWLKCDSRWRISLELSLTTMVKNCLWVHMPQ